MTYEFNNIYCEDSYNAIKNIPCIKIYKQISMFD